MRTLQSNLTGCRGDARAFSMPKRGTVPRPYKGRRLINQHITCSASAGLWVLHGGSSRRNLTCQRTATVAKATGSGAVRTAEGTVRFSVQRETVFGESVKLVGSGPYFGEWNPASAPTMTWGEGNIWAVDLSLPAGDYTFKFVVYREDGSATWEDGDNRSLQVPADLAANAILEAQAGWGNTQSTSAVVVQVEGGATVEEGATSTSTSSSNGNGVHAASGAVADLAEESSTNGVESSNGTESERTGTMKVYRPAGKAWAAVKGNGVVAAVLESLSPAASTSNGTAPQEETAEMVAAAAATPEAAPDAPAGNTPDSTAGSTASSASTPSTIDDSSSSSSSSSSSGGDTLVAVLSILATPVIAWSLYTLKSTGCGLPPGPNGLLGAAEGVSYVAVAVGALCAVGRRARSNPSTPLLITSEVLSYASVAAGLVVLVMQVTDYGYIPSPLPDANCFGSPSSPSSVGWAAPAVSLPSSSDLLAKFSKLSSALPSTSDVTASISMVSASLSELPTTITIEIPPGVTQVSDAFIATLTQIPASVSTNLNQLSAQISQVSSSLPDVSAQVNAQVSELSKSVPDVSSLVSDLHIQWPPQK